MYNVAMFEDAISKLAQTNLRNIIGGVKLDDTLSSRDRINVDLRKILDEITDRWGVRVTRVEIQDIKPPQDIVDAMSRQMKAERVKRAVTLEAEGLKNAEVLKAEGKKLSEILDSEGKAKAIENVAEAERRRKSLIAEGEANAIERVFSAIHDGKPTRDILTLKYLETLGQMANGQATKIFMPFETSGLLSGAAMIGDMLKEGGEVKKLVSKGDMKESSLSSASANRNKEKK
jgi:regulator of protease activity HflC (stomatin/prohibitin superfamily)